MKEILASLALIVLLVFILNPFHFWMPMPIQIAVLGGLAAAFGAIAVFALRERAADEREAAHRSFAGRIAYLSGAAVLLAGITLQSLDHSIDPWLVGALAFMVVAKTAARIYSDLYS
ncbi:MAG: hypothetical protein HYS26_02340 [Candidatus Kaiserbacteria bacterium]|nr:MAG: hypothetical protein HYS26_02340 [Candidatus Kaiserbacteria bacterium]